MFSGNSDVPYNIQGLLETIRKGRADLLSVIYMNMQCVKNKKPT